MVTSAPAERARAVRPSSDTNEGQMGDLPVTGVMSRPVLTVTGDRTLAEALSVLAGTGLEHVAVVDGDGHCMGVLSDRTIADHCVRDPDALGRRRASEALDGPPVSVPSRATVAEVATVMLTHGRQAVPVVDDAGALTGLVTTAGLVAMLAGAHVPGG